MEILSSSLVENGLILEPFIQTPSSGKKEIKSNEMRLEGRGGEGREEGMTWMQRGEYE